MLSVPETEQGMTYTLCGDGFEILESPDGMLLVRHAGESDVSFWRSRRLPWPMTKPRTCSIT